MSINKLLNDIKSLAESIEEVESGHQLEINSLIDENKRLKTDNKQLKYCFHSLQKWKNIQNLRIINLKSSYESINRERVESVKRLEESESQLKLQLKESLEEKQLNANLLQNTNLEMQSIVRRFEEIISQSKYLLKQFHKQTNGQTLQPINDFNRWSVQRVSELKIKIKCRENVEDYDKDSHSIQIENIVEKCDRRLQMSKIGKLESTTDQTINNIHELMFSFKSLLNDYQILKNEKEMAFEQKDHIFERFLEMNAKYDKCLKNNNHLKEKMKHNKFAFNYMKQNCELSDDSVKEVCDSVHQLSEDMLCEHNKALKQQIEESLSKFAINFKKRIIKLNDDSIHDMKAKRLKINETQIIKSLHLEEEEDSIDDSNSQSIS